MESTIKSLKYSFKKNFRWDGIDFDILTRSNTQLKSIEAGSSPPSRTLPMRCPRCLHRITSALSVDNSPTSAKSSQEDFSFFSVHCLRRNDSSISCSKSFMCSSGPGGNFSRFLQNGYTRSLDLQSMKAPSFTSLGPNQIVARADLIQLDARLASFIR